jgi:D-sedoheptulose 7-phosphate isomerase
MSSSGEKIQSDFEDAVQVHHEIATNETIKLQIIDLAERCVSALNEGSKIIFAGNGGSFADSQHLAAELISRLQFDRAPLPAVALGTNSSSTTAIANDYGYEQIFVRELSVISHPGDVYIPISTSGNSKNILVSVKVAVERGLHTVGFTGDIGGELAKICQCVKIPSNRTERIQEGHILIGHVLCGLIEDKYFSKS